DLLYGGSVQSLIAGEVVQPPLWVSEGLAEFQSVGWNTDMDMMVRDAVLNNYIPDMNLLQYYMVYQGGASVFRYIADTYGREKIGEILHKTRGKVSFERVMKSSLGVGYREFTDRWHRYLKKQYWPDVADRKEPVEIAKQLTHHARESNSYNYAPTLSPNGDKIAYIAD
ncbi:MAG: biopolymer transporter Tol, partial [Calditrichaeota bacterium]|nr:biopolymer transporter Tol [Calditrichota bacterium]